MVNKQYMCSGMLYTLRLPHKPLIMLGAVSVFMTTQQMSMVHTNIDFAHQSISSYGMHETFILHIKIYCHARAKFKVYKTQPSSDVHHMCIISHTFHPLVSLRCAMHRL